MTRESYVRVTGILRKSPKRVRFAKAVNGVLTRCVFLLYPMLLAGLFLQKHPFLMRAVLVPFTSFVAVSLFRNWFHAPRPYEKFGIPPVLEKDTKGKSFPSRHVFSAFVIAMTVYYLYPGAGVLFFAAGIGIGTIRVLGGVHEPVDIVAGAAAGIASGLLGYYVI